MQKKLLVLIPLIFAVIVSASVINTDTSDAVSGNLPNLQNQDSQLNTVYGSNSTDISSQISNNIKMSSQSIRNNNKTTSNQSKNQNKLDTLKTIIITGIVNRCDNGDPFEGVTITVNSLAGDLLASTVTDADGLYKLIFQSTDTEFKVTASYPSHQPKTSEVTVSHNPNNSSDLNFYGTANFQLGTLVLINGSCNILGIDSNLGSAYPNEGLLQIHIVNNGTTNATNIWANLNLLPGNETYIYLATNESSKKFIGNLTPGQSVDVWYLIGLNTTTKVVSNNKATRNYSINVWGDNTGTNSTLNGTLTRDAYQSQNRNTVQSIQLLNTTPIRTGDVFQVLVVSNTASDYTDLILPLQNYNPNIIQPINYTVNWINNKGQNKTLNDLCLQNPGKATFYSTWTFKAISSGITSFYAFIDDVSGASSHYNSEYNSTLTVLNVAPKVDVASNKTVINLINPGQTIEYNDLINYVIKISNYGPDNATGVNYTDILPAGLIYLNHTISTNGGNTWTANSTAYNTTSGIWNIGTIAANSINQYILNITARVNATGFITNNANKTALNEFDSNLTNDNSTVTTYVPRADVYSDKTVSNLNRPGEQIQYNDLILYNITISNAGPNGATGVNYTDILPAGLIYLNHTISTNGGNTWTANSTAYNTTSGIWNIGTIAANTVNQYILQITARVNATDFITNWVNKTAMTEFDTNKANDNSTVTLYVPEADVGIKTDILPASCPNQSWPPVLGQIIFFQINATNYGPDHATGVTITDMLPGSVTYKDYSLSTDGGTTWTLSKNLTTSVYNATTGVWNVGNLTTDNTNILMIRGTVNKNSTTITNTANKTAQNEYDPNSANNNATSSVYVPG